jgi:hypothetical protein
MELTRIREGLSISRTSACALARLGYCFIRAIRVYEQGASRKIVVRSITPKGRATLDAATLLGQMKSMNEDL